MSKRSLLKITIRNGQHVKGSTRTKNYYKNSKTTRTSHLDDDVGGEGGWSILHHVAVHVIIRECDLKLSAVPYVHDARVGAATCVHFTVEERGGGDLGHHL